MGKGGDRKLMADLNPDFMKDFDMEFDFGFTTVASKPDEEVQKQTATIEKVSQDSGVISQKLAEIETKVDNVLVVAERKFDARLEEKQLELDTANSVLFKQLEQLTLPLLYNLYKTSEEPYIHWPNRQQQLQTQIEKILKITRGE